MRFWDSSAIVPTLVVEPSSAELRALAGDGREIVAWWGTPVECASAIARRERSGNIAAPAMGDALETLARRAADWYEVAPSDAVRDDARRLVRIHDLPAADGLQLAAARAGCADRPESLPFVTLDERLALAASREGFPVLASGI